MAKKLFVAVLMAVLASLAVTAFLATRGITWGSQLGPIKEGGRLYASNCAGCHGPAGNRIPVVPLNSWDYLSQVGDPYLMSVVSQGKEGMPAYARDQGGLLAAEEIESIVRYLRSSDGPAGKTVVPVPRDGHQLYLENCSSCHGLDGGKLPQAKIGSESYVNSRGESAITRVIGTGQGKMPAFASTLQPNQVKEILGYLRSLSPASERAGGALPSSSPLPSLKIPHSVEDRLDNCLVCHGPTGMLPAPADHDGRSNKSCPACHKGVSSGAQAQKPTGVPRVGHELKGREDCLVCHGSNGLLPVPDDHEGRTKEMCLGCHRPAETALATPRTPHELEGREDCLACHKAGFMAAMPDDHAGRPQDKCTDCHKPGSGSPSKPIPQITHDITRAQDCLKCHGPKPTPTKSG